MSVICQNCFNYGKPSSWFRFEFMEDTDDTPLIPSDFCVSFHILFIDSQMVQEVTKHQPFTERPSCDPNVDAIHSYRFSGFSEAYSGGEYTKTPL
jgi:hypothetical protein